MSTPDQPRPYATGRGRDERAWNGSANSRGRYPDDYGSARGYGRGNGRSRGDGYGRGRGAQGGDGYGARSDGYGGDGSYGRGDGYSRGNGRRSAGGRGGYPGGRGGYDSGRGGYDSGEPRTGWQRMADRVSEQAGRLSERAGRGRAASRQGGPEWGQRGPGNGREWRGGTAVRDRYPATLPAGAQYRGDGRLRGLTERRPGPQRTGRGRGPGGYGPRPPRKGDWWRRWSWKKALTLTAISGGVGVVIIAAAVGYEYSRTTIPSIDTAAIQQASTVYFSNGQEVSSFGSVDRQILAYDQIPALMREAAVAAEDKHFYHEGGISPTGILRSVYHDLTTSSGNPQGGSTLTQELVRNYYNDIGTAQTFSRKIKEIFVAEKLAHRYSKQWVLTHYLNVVYFGDGAYGVQAAAETYFGVPASKLTLSQAAMIAAMPQQPSFYTPDPKGGAGYQGLVYRWHYVLNTMQQLGYITAQQASQAKFPKMAKSVNTSWSGYRGYIMQAVFNELQSRYGFSKAKIDNGGLHITTTFNEHLMNSLYATVGHMKTLMRQCAPPSTAVTGGGNVVANGYRCNPSAGWKKWTNLGAVLENPANGAIQAMYSGPNYNTQQYDDALVARNQVGSSFKPYVLAAAVKQGMNVQTSKLNGYSPLYIPPDSQPTVYASQKKHTTGGWYGPITNDEAVPSQGPIAVYKATAESLNTAYTDLWHRVAYNVQTQDHPVTDMAKAFGVNVGPYPNGAGMAGGHDPMQDYAGIALGQASLTVEEQANTIATLANGGTYHQPHVVAKIAWQDPASGMQVVKKAVIKSHPVLTPQQAADVDWALSFDNQPGLGTAPGEGMNNGQPVIAKTGTTNLAQQAFFMGAVPRYAMAVGMFVSDNRCPPALVQACKSKLSLSYAPPMGHGMQTLFGIGGLAGYGGGWPAAIWHAYFNQEFSSLPIQQWPSLNTTGMATWNLVGQLPVMPKPHPNHQPGPHPHGCFGNVKKCPGGGGTGGGGGGPGGPPTPAPTPTPTCTSVLGCNPSPTPSGSGNGSGGGTGGGAPTG